MRTTIVFFLIGLFAIAQLQAQVKIGDNPQNIDPAAVLELESSTMALIITRVTTEQMEAIVPGQGALVYNTDTACVHYYNGTEWVNLCAGANVNITANSIVNQAENGSNQSTIVLTQTEDGTNVEVATESITGNQILDGSIRGADFNDNSITGPKLANNAVTTEKISENAVGPFAINRDSLPLSFFNNDVPFLVAGDITTVSEDADNSITPGGDGGAFFDASPLFDAVANDLDDDPENEVQALSRSGNELILTRPNGANFMVLLDDLAGTGTDNQNLGPTSLDAMNILTIGIENGMETTVDLSSLAGGDTGSTEVVDGITLTGVGTAVDPFTIEPSVNTGEFLTTDAAGDVVWTAITPGGGSTEVVDGITLTGVGTIADPFTIEPSVNTGEFLTTDAAGDVVWTAVTPGGGSTEVVDGTTLSGLGSVADPFTIEPSVNAGEFLTTNAVGEVVWTTVTPGGSGTTEVVDMSTLTGAGTIADPFKIEPSVNINEVLTTNADGDVVWAAGASGSGDDNQTASEVPYDGTTSMLTAVNTQEAIDELVMNGATDNQNDTEVELETVSDIDADGTDETTVQQAIAAILAVNSDDQNDTEVTLATASDIDADGTDETTVQQAIAAILAVNSDDQNDTEVTLATASDIDADGTDETTVQQAIAAILAVNSDDQNDTEVTLATASDIDADGTDETTVQQAIAAILAVNSDDQNDTEVTLATASDIDADGTDETTVQQAIAAILAVNSDDQNDTEVTLATASDIDADGTDETTVQQAITALVAVNSDDQNDTEVALATASDIDEDGNDETTVQQAIAAILAVNSDDQNDTEVTLATASDINADGTDETTVQQAIAALVAVNSDDQTAAEVSYDPDMTGDLPTTISTTQAAIDALAAVSNSNLSTTNLTQESTVDRTYDINGGNLIFTGTGSVGIGNDANPPQNKLHVSGEIRAEGLNSSDGTLTNPALRFADDTDRDTGIYRPAADEIGFPVGGIEAMRIDEYSTGNTQVLFSQRVGIGFALPGDAPYSDADANSSLDVRGSISTAVRVGDGAVLLRENDYTFLFDGNGTIDLPAANTCVGRIYIIKNPSHTVDLAGLQTYVGSNGVPGNTAIPSGTIWLQSINNEWHEIN